MTATIEDALRMRELLGRVLGRTIPADEELTATCDDLEAYLTEREHMRRLDAEHLAWQFHENAPQLVVQVYTVSGDKILASVAGGACVDDLGGDRFARTMIHMLLDEARENLNATEPTRTEGRAL